MPIRINPLQHRLKSVISTLIVFLLLTTLSAIAQEKCTIQYSGKLYTTKSEQPISCHRPDIDDKNFIYDTTPIKEESETVTLPLRQSIMFVDEIAGWFVVFDKKDHLCSSESVFTPPTGEYNFTALTKKNELIKGFVPNVYLNRINPSSYPAYANSLKQDSPEQILVSDLVISVGMVRNDNYKVNVHVNAADFKGYQSKLIELLSLPQSEFSDKVAIATQNQDNHQQTIASTNESEIHDSPSQNEADKYEDTGAQQPDEKDNATASNSPTQSKAKPAKPAKEKKKKEKKVKEKKGKAPKPKKEDKTAPDSTSEMAESISSYADEDTSATASYPATEDLPRTEEKDQIRDEASLAEKTPAAMQEDISESKSDNTPMVEETKSSEKAAIVEIEDLSSGQLNLGKRYVPKDNPEMTEADKEEISEIAMIQLKRLEDCFKTLVDRSINSHIKKKMRENTVKTLFVNDKAEVSVSSTASAKIGFHFIPEYLERLEKMFYQRVEIDFSDIHKVTDLKKNPDGTWTGIVTFTQVFKGYDQVDGLIPRYGDITHKNVTIIVRRVETFSGDARPDVEWIVLLGDIGVNETQKL